MDDKFKKDLDAYLKKVRTSDKQRKTKAANVFEKRGAATKQKKEKKQTADDLIAELGGGVDQKTIPGLVELIKKLKKTGVTIITIEHNINIIMEISDNVLALDQGKRIAFGPPKEIQKNKQVIDAYLGTFDAA